MAGLQTTLGWLERTRNEASVDVLLRALDSNHAEIREGALRALLKRTSGPGQKELVQRWHTLSDEWKEVVAENPRRIASAVRGAILSKDERLCTNGCDAVLWIREYELIPTLITATEDRSNPFAELAAATLLSLTERLYDELSGPRDYEKTRRDPQRVRQHAVSALEQSVDRFGSHEHPQVLESFLLLANRDNLVLKKILGSPRHPSYLVLIDILVTSPRAGIMRLLLGYLEDRHAPSAALGVLARRGDLSFVRALLRKIGYEPSGQVKPNLRRIEQIGWLREDLRLLDAFDEVEQHAAVQLMVCSGMRRLELFQALRYLLEHGNRGGRRAASQALSGFGGTEANELAVAGLNDEDPQVRANMARQLRERGIPGAITRLIQLLDSEHEVVRQAARESLSEFSFARYIRAFDMLEPEIRRSTGTLVRKVDTQAAELLAEEMESTIRSRRLRALEAAVSLRLEPRVESILLRLTNDEDHFIRAAVARALGGCNSPHSRRALNDMLDDTSTSVRDTAEDSLARLEQPRDDTEDDMLLPHVIQFAESNGGN